MSEYSGIVSFAVALAINLFLFGTLAAVGVAAAFRLAENASPRLRYLLAIAAFFIAALAPVILTFRGVSTFVKTPIRIAEPVPMHIIDTGIGQEAVETEISPSMSAVTESAPIEQTGPFENIVSYIGTGQMANALFAIWLAGAALLLSREFEGHLRLNKIRREFRPAPAELRRELSCPLAVRLYISESACPMTFGLLHPIVVLPARFPDDMPRAAVRCILRHETAHTLWRDPLASAILRMIRALFWVSPALWFLERRARSEMEAAADHSALRVFPATAKDASATGLTAAEYAVSLVAIAKLSNRIPGQKILGLAAATHFGAHSSCLESRVRRLLSKAAKPGGARLALAISAAASGILGMAFLPVATQTRFPDQPVLAGTGANRASQEPDVPRTGRDLPERLQNEIRGDNKVFKDQAPGDEFAKNRFDNAAAAGGATPTPTPQADRAAPTPKPSDENETADPGQPVPAFPAIAPVPLLPAVAPVPLLPAVAPVPSTRPIPGPDAAPSIQAIKPEPSLAPVRVIKPIKRPRPRIG